MCERSRRIIPLGARLFLPRASTKTTAAYHFFAVILVENLLYQRVRIVEVVSISGSGRVRPMRLDASWQRRLTRHWRPIWESQLNLQSDRVGGWMGCLRSSHSVGCSKKRMEFILCPNRAYISRRYLPSEEKKRRAKTKKNIRNLM